MARTRRQAPPQRLILDACAAIGLFRGDVRARAALTAALGAGADVSVSAVVVAETVRGGAADALVNPVLKAVGEVDVADERVGRTAVRLLGGAGSTATVDTVVVATAVEAGGAVILTGDAGDLGRLAADQPRVIIEPGSGAGAALLDELVEICRLGLVVLAGAVVEGVVEPGALAV